MGDDAQETPRTAETLRSLTFGFDEQPLEHFRGLNAAEIEAHAGIGPRFRVRIQEALAELAALTGEDYSAVETPTSADHAAPSVSHHAVDADLEPAGPGTAGPLVIIAVIVLVLLIIGSAIWVAKGQDGGAELEAKLTEAQQQVEASQVVFGKLADESAAQAERQATAVYTAARARNLGAALEQIDDLEATLATMAEAVTASASVASNAPGEASEQLTEPGAAVPPDPKVLLAAATAALEQARAALMMTQPQTQSGLETACRNLELAVRALGGDEVKE